jgi:hypothetical protein
VIADEDLASPYIQDGESRFSSRIENFVFPAKTKISVSVRTYDGSTDPEDHKHTFITVAKVEGWAMPVYCQMFVQTLS